MNAEVIVVGAGIVGSACAHELACRGLDVLVLDLSLIHISEPA
ncbi:FAD-dependent oxidoreductase, partial [Pseudomonas aeruginosa]|nr:FAD-dependent oxidoreductase [Pseudomonas aeruginosa]